MRIGTCLAIVVTMFAAFYIDTADAEDPIRIPAAVCQLIREHIDAVDAVCAEHPTDDKLRADLLYELWERWQRGLWEHLEGPWNDTFKIVDDAEISYRAWSHKILWGAQSSFWRSQIDTMNFWRSERQKALAQLKGFCRGQ